MIHKLVSIETAEKELGLPPGWLRVQAAAGKVPHLRAEDVVLVRVDAVEELLADSARLFPECSDAAANEISELIAIFADQSQSAEAKKRTIAELDRVMELVGRCHLPRCKRCGKRGAK